MMVTMSVRDPLMVGPSWYPVVMLGRLSVVSSSITRLNVNPLVGPGLENA